METIIVNKDNLDGVICEVKNNRPVILPTETVYGIGANAMNEEAVKNIFTVKQRKQNNPLNVLIADMEMVETLATDINETERKIMQKFWPGPLTIIVPKNKNVPEVVTAGSEYIGIRMPDNDVARKIIREAEMPLAAPSANISGKPSGTLIEDIKNEFNGKVKYIVDDGISKFGIESTVVKVVDGIAIILRPGCITKEDFIAIGIDAKYDENIFKKVDANETVLSEGMKNKHYVPSINCIVAAPENLEEVVDKIQNKITQNPNEKIIVIAKTENISKYKYPNVIEVLDMGSSVMEISQKIFHILRSLENKKASFAIIEGMEQKGLGVAVMNRIIRACEYKIIK